jgi:hypothetical protein
LNDPLFELEWYGGMPAARLRRRRGDVDAFPWGTLDTRDLAPATVLAARRSYTEGALNEYRTGAAFAELSRALLRARAPVDLTAMCADFVVDEMSHVELNARMAMELGSAAPMNVDLANLGLDVSAESPIEQAMEIAVRVSCVGETLSAPLLAIAARNATHPLTKTVLQRLASEEGAHGAIGWLILEWAEERLDADVRGRLARIAEQEIEAAFSDWTSLETAPQAADEAGFAQVGFVQPAAFLEQARKALRTRVAAPLARLGIDLDHRLIDRLAPSERPCSPLR